MPSITSELINYLKTFSEITDLVGSGVAARIYIEEAKQGVALPYVTIDTYTGWSAEHLRGISGSGQNRVEINAFAATESEMYQLGENIRRALQGKFGFQMGQTWIDSVTSQDGYETYIVSPEPGGNQRRYWYQRDFTIVYVENNVNLGS